jgi:hypothetical protein
LDLQDIWVAGVLSLGSLGLPACLSVYGLRVSGSMSASAFARLRSRCVNLSRCIMCRLPKIALLVLFILLFVLLKHSTTSVSHRIVLRRPEC